MAATVMMTPPKELPDKVLLIEDDKDYAKLLSKGIEEESAGKISIEQVSQLTKGLYLLTKERFNAVLLDLGLHEGHGIENLKRLQKSAPEMPVVVLTGSKDEKEGIEAVTLGAQDYLTKEQLNSSILDRTIHFAITRNQHLLKWKQAWKDEFNRATHDPLTDLPNRALFQDRLLQMITEAKRYSFGLAVLLIDLDHFKEVNETWGHTPGDHVLCEVAKRFRSHLREVDTVARFGADEFVVLLNQIREAGEAQKVAERLVASLSEPITFPHQTVRISASVGISLYPLHARLPEDLLHRADMALYTAKRGGGNCARLFSLT